MHAEWINIILAFIEGFALILSPCILPILPIILSGSLTSSKSRPIGIIAGFVLTFTLVTLFSRYLIAATQISFDTLTLVSYGLLILLGIIMMSEYLTNRFSTLTSGFSNTGRAWDRANDAQSGFGGGLLFGALVGLIWTPCAGPILAAVIVQVVVQETTFGSILTVVAFSIGAGLPMLLIALVGRKIIDNLKFLRNRTSLIRKFLGAIIILMVGVLYFQATPLLSSDADAATEPPATTLIQGLDHPYLAPEIVGIDAWINSSPLTLPALKGKVVLIDFWTYSCINCLRTLPYLKDWYAKYHQKGFEIIGVHSPEFEFEKSLDNVKRAVKRLGITYPVALDNRFSTWRNYQNRYWPAHYLINQAGEVVYIHFGEGEYATTENNIRYLLGLDQSQKTQESSEPYSSRQTPELYLGYARTENFSSLERIIKNQTGRYTYPKQLSPDHWALQGDWIVYPDKIVSAGAGASLKLNFRATKVFAVMGAQDDQVEVNILLNGKPVTGVLRVQGHLLYDLIHLQKEDSGILEMIASQPGLEIYTFTFGS